MALPACPECGTPAPDRAAAAAGHCETCKRHTGLCQAGRPRALQFIGGLLTTTGGADWRHMCTRRGDGGRWKVITIEGASAVGVLCTTHAAALRHMADARQVRLAQRIPDAPWQRTGFARWWYQVFPGWPGGPKAAGRHA